MTEGSTAMPKHVSIIMDGNGRWAKARHLPRSLGHRAGSKAVKKAVEYCIEHAIPVLSLFAFGIENRLNRPTDEVNFLLNLFLESFRKNTAELHKQNIRIEVVGDRSQLDETLRKHVEHAEQLTCNNTRLHLILAVDYSGRWDITQAVQHLVADGLSPEAINESCIQQYLCFNQVPPPDLLIRTSGEQRLSNFMLWQMAYTEFFFTDVLWPDFDKATFQTAIDAYQSRERRFGYTGDQLKEYHA